MTVEHNMIFVWKGISRGYGIRNFTPRFMEIAGEIEQCHKGIIIV